MVGPKCLNSLFSAYLLPLHEKHLSQILSFLKNVSWPLMPQNTVQIIVGYLQSSTLWSQCTFPTSLLKFLPKHFQICLCLCHCWEGLTLKSSSFAVQLKCPFFYPSPIPKAKLFLCTHPMFTTPLAPFLHFIHYT